jgi:hypothetical protein
VRGETGEGIRKCRTENYVLIGEGSLELYIRDESNDCQNLERKKHKISSKLEQKEGSKTENFPEQRNLRRGKFLPLSITDVRLH